MVENILKLVSLAFIVTLPFISYRNFRMEAKSKRSFYFWKVLFISSTILLVVTLLPMLIYFFISR